MNFQAPMISVDEEIGDRGQTPWQLTGGIVPPGLIPYEAILELSGDLAPLLTWLIGKFKR